METFPACWVIPCYNNYGENNTGRMTFATNLTNGASADPTLDRSWYYDHVGRLDVAYTGSEARATIGTDTSGHPDGPYAHDYNYDVWGNLTSRAGWGGWNAQYTATFNNKNQMLTNSGNSYGFIYESNRTSQNRFSRGKRLLSANFHPSQIVATKSVLTSRERIGGKTASKNLWYKATQFECPHPLLRLRRLNEFSTKLRRRYFYQLRAQRQPGAARRAARVD